MSLHAELVEVATLLESGRSGVDGEQGDAVGVGLGPGVGDGHNHHHIAQDAVGDEHLQMGNKGFQSTLKASPSSSETPDSPNSGVPQT